MKDKTKIAQTSLVLAAGVAVFVLYFFGKTISTGSTPTEMATVEDHSDHDHSSDADTNAWLQEAERSLTKQETSELNQLKNSNNNSGVAAFWAERSKHDIAALYKSKHAEAESNFKNWDTTGDAAIVAFRNNQDSAKVSYFINQALTAYSNALLLEDNITTKLKLAKIQTEITGQTMEGVMLLREIVESDPQHIQANYELGALSIRSGQWEKALERFNTVITADPNLVDAYVLKAQILVQLEKRDEALATLRAANAKASSPEITNAIQQIINDIEKN